jgi:AcrR family transcriptional regulator
MSTSRRKPAQRPPLSNERVLDAAVEFVDRHGVEALSMRKLAQELGVEAMSLYNHVANKGDILDGIVEAVANEIELLPAGADWRDAIRQAMTSAHAAFLRHRWAPRLWMRPGTSGTGRMRFAEALLRALREGGFSEGLTYRAFHVLQSHVLGYTLQELDFPLTSEEVTGMATRFLDAFPKDEFVYLHEHVMQHVEGTFRGGSGFEFGLELILDGLERLRDEP